MVKYYVLPLSGAGVLLWKILDPPLKMESVRKKAYENNNTFRIYTIVRVDLCSAVE